jgi:hypothetical protein
MSISSLNFIFSQFETEKYRYFGIYDEDGDLVFSQNDLIDADRALTKLRSFFRDNQGYFTIRVFNKKLANTNNLVARDNSTIAKYNVEVNAPVLPQGVNGLTGMGGNPMLPPDDPRSNAPNMFQLLGQMSQVEQQMKLMEKDHQHYREMKELQDRIAKMEEEQGKSRGMGAIVDRLGEQFSDPSVLLGLISGVSQLFNKKSEPVMPMHGIRNDEMMPMNGVDEQVINNISTRREKMVGAVNFLMQHDKDFPENISRLAELAKNKPAIYSMAVSYLNNL